MEGKKEMASWSVLAAVDGLLLRGCVVACETDRSAQAKGVEYLTRFVHTLPLADTPLAAPRACLPTLPSISKAVFEILETVDSVYHLALPHG